MANDQPWKVKGVQKDEWLKGEVAKAVNAGEPLECETVDFSDPHRPLTCIEVDFPIIPINETAGIEASSGAATKPIYQMSKWWARRQASVFRSMLIASAMKAPYDSSGAAKCAWDAYYGNHQKKGAFKDLKVADIFMGGGTTLVEGSRLGMQMFGNDLNPVAWLVVKNELAQVDKSEVEALLADVEAEVKPQVMPYYICDCPRGHKGAWVQVSTNTEMDENFNPLALMPEERKDYNYRGPEIIYAFWAKHGPCQVTGCGHRTPIMTNPVVAQKSFSVTSWTRACKRCGCDYDLEERDARMSPSVPLVVADTERPFAVATLDRYSGAPNSAECPSCRKAETFGKLGKGKRKKIDLTLLVHPEWLRGEAGSDEEGQMYGGSADDDANSTSRWNEIRASKIKLLEIRGKLPYEITCPETGEIILTGNEGGTVKRKSTFTCQAATCGREQNVLESVKAFGRSAPFAEYAYQVYCSECDGQGDVSGGRFIVPSLEPKRTSRASDDWQALRDDELLDYWPKSELSKGWKTHGWAVPEHGYTHYYLMFFQRQLIQHALLLKTIWKLGDYSQQTREAALGAFTQFLRYSCIFTFWHAKNNQTSAFLSNNNFQMKNTVVETKAYSPVGDGSFLSATKKIGASCDYRENPWDLVCKEYLQRLDRSDLASTLTGRTTKVYPADKITSNGELTCGSSSDLGQWETGAFDLVITDPPFGEIMQYAELSDFFYVWVRLVLKNCYPTIYSPEYTPKALEAVANPYRNESPEEYYKSILTACWRESARLLKDGGILAFTFHHDKDGPWVSVLESLFDAGFYLINTFPIRGDASKGDEKVAFGAEKVEFDIIHVCRKRYEDPTPISWAKLRRHVLSDVRDLQDLLEHHQDEGLPEADLQVIRRGKALEYFSRHYGKVYKNQDDPMSVLEALIGINQLLDEEAGGIKEAPPHNAEPFTRMLLRLFDGVSDLPRDQMQKFLRGTGSAPSDFTRRGWTYEKKKIFFLTSPLELAQAWTGKHRKGLQSDYDQAMFLIGACFEGSGINANETLNNDKFKPHPALGAILIWFKTHGADSPVRNAAITAAKLYQNWESKNQTKVQQLTLFDEMGEENV